MPDARAERRPDPATGAGERPAAADTDRPAPDEAAQERPVRDAPVPQEATANGTVPDDAAQDEVAQDEVAQDEAAQTQAAQAPAVQAQIVQAQAVQDPARQDAFVPEEAGLLLDVDGAVATITLNRPERRNAMTFATWRGLAAIGRSLPADVRVVVLRGAGPSFSAGIDLSMFAGEGDGFPDGSDPEAADRFIAGLQEGYTWLRRPDLVTVAAVHGHAIGGAFQLALACDIRVAADDAKFCMKEPALGLVPDLTGTKPLVDIVGVNRALELCLTARTVLADEAARLGLAEIVVPRAELDTAVADLVTALLAVGPGASAATKRLLRQAPGNTLEEQCAAERREQIGRLRDLFA